jgi:tRNA(fMet)-specific endonuclease VapC
MSSTRFYLLDTNIISALARQPDGAVAKKINKLKPEQIATSLIVSSEIRFGLAKSNSPRLIENLSLILDNLEILPLEAPVDTHYADIRFALERSGTPIGPNDLFIAAHARALGRTLVTDNVREFERVSGLKVENWLDSRDKTSSRY